MHLLHAHRLLLLLHLLRAHRMRMVRRVLLLLRVRMLMQMLLLLLLLLLVRERVVVHVRVRGRRAREHGRHVPELALAEARELVQPAEADGLLRGLLVRVAVLLEPLDAVLHLGAREPREQHARLVAAHVHHRWVETLRRREKEAVSAAERNGGRKDERKEGRGGGGVGACGGV